MVLAVNTEQKNVGMGEIVVAQAPVILAAVLGSCVGVAAYCPRLRLGGLAHVVLPRANGLVTNPGKFADTAVPHLLALMERKGALRSELVIKIAGGACMFGQGGPLQIGDDNAEVVLAVLQREGLRVAGQDLGGTQGRRVSLDCATGALHIDCVGMPRKTL
jgi:chemotaxis protein CheD